MAREILENGITQISVENPDAFNALSSEIITGLVTDFTTACADPTTRVIIFRGGAVKKYLAPLAGADLNGLVNVSDPAHPKPATGGAEHLLEGIQAIEKIRALCARENKSPGRVVVLGMVDGPCLAGGMEFMFGLTDLVFATTRSVFGMREIGLGGMGGWRGPETLRRILCSPMWAKEMLLAAGDGKMGDISAITACRRGLVNRLYREDEIVTKTLETAARLTELDPMAVTYNLAAVEHPWGEDCTDAVTRWMTELMLGDAWVQKVSGFLAGQR